MVSVRDPPPRRARRPLGSTPIIQRSTGCTRGERHDSNYSRHSPRDGDRNRSASKYRLLHAGCRPSIGQGHGQLRRSRHLSFLLRRQVGTTGHDSHVLSVRVGWPRPQRKRHGRYSDLRGVGEIPGRLDSSACRARRRRVDGPFTRFSRPTIGFRDPDGLKLEIAAVDGLEPTDAARSDRDVAASIGGFGAVTLCVEAPERTIELLTETFGYRHIAEDSGRRRLRAANASDGTIGAELDVLCHPEAIHGRLGGGTVHHIAFRAQTDEEQHVWREKIVALGFNVTPVLDRQYFRSIYFREPGGILFEIAIDPPGFAVDETADRLGTSLKLPPWLEPKRADIERSEPGGRALHQGQPMARAG